MPGVVEWGEVFREMMDQSTPMDECQLRAEWYAIAHRLDALAEKVMTSLPPIARDDGDAVAKLVAIASLTRKAHRDFKAMLLLDVAGFCDSAETLARVVLDACISVIYINKEPLERGTQFWQYEFQQRADLGKKAAQLWPADEKAESKLAEFHSFITEHSPPGKGRLHWPDAGKMIDDLPVGLKELYSVALKSYHYEVHALPLALRNRYLQFVDDHILVRRDPLPVDPQYALMDVCGAFQAALECTCTIAKIDMPYEMDSIHARIIAIIARGNAERRDDT